MQSSVPYHITTREIIIISIRILFILSLSLLMNSNTILNTMVKYHNFSFFFALIYFPDFFASKMNSIIYRVNASRQIRISSSILEFH